MTVNIGDDGGDELLIFTNKCNPVKSYLYSLEDVNVNATDKSGQSYLEIMRQNKL